MTSFPYESRVFDPPAPVAEVHVGHPRNGRFLVSQGLLDSGADVTAVPESAVTDLQLQPLDRMRVSGIGQGVFVRYLVTVDIPGLGSVELRAIAWPENYALLGRDLLSGWRTVLDGPKQELTIEGVGP